MCTATFVPRSPNGFVLTFSRDEVPSRSPQALERTKIGTVEFVFPRDTAGGTWLALSSEGAWACVLNGAFSKHLRQPPYKRSRGLVLLDSLRAPSPKAFFDSYNFNGIEPFTMISYGSGEFLQFVWDGHDAHLSDLDAKARYIWSSATLYPPEWQARRRGWFAAWLQSCQQPSAEDILNFHYTGGEKDPQYGFVMRRENGPQTVSISQISKENNVANFKYIELISNILLEKNIHIQT
jgi:uncharacterized protein with NRDE domain